jgi:hypothetical protein
MLDRGTTAQKAMTWPSWNSPVGLLMLQLLMPALTAEKSLIVFALDFDSKQQVGTAYDS